MRIPFSSVLVPCCFVLWCEGACLPVNGDRILGRDLAPHVAGLEALPPESLVGYAAVPGMVRVLRIEGLIRVGKRHGLKAEPTQDVCFEIPTKMLDEESMMAAMRSSLPEGASIEIVEASRFKVPAGPVTFPRVGLAVSTSTPASATVLWRGKVQFASTRSVPIWARVRVWRVARFLVASRDLKAGEALAQADVELREGPKGVFLPDGVESVDDYRTRRSLHAGDEILARDLAPIPAIESGDDVKVRIESAGAVLRTPAKAMSTARVGEDVLLRNPHSGRIFRARVEGHGMATVSMK